MKTEIISLLRESEGYVSGQELCNHFGVSRTAIWKVMNQLKDAGYEIESVSKKGYKLVKQPDVLSKSELDSRMHTKWAGREIHFYEETGSTSDDAKRLAAQGSSHGTLVVADKQTAGKGRRGRQWESPPREAIYMSIALKPEFEPDKASMLTVVAALAVCKGIEETTKLEVEIKWPNDLLVNRKKVCGILTEMDLELGYIHSIVVGIGINANMTAFSQELSQKATSLSIESGQTIIRAELIERCLYYFEQYYELFLETEDLSNLLEEYHKRLANLNQIVKVLDPQNPYEGVAKGIDVKGQLMVETTQGLRYVYAGEVSVRGIYGYT